MVKYILAIFIFFECMTFDSYGKTIKTSSLSELFSYADVVVYAQVVSGKLNYHQGESCGAQYKGKVINLFKGKNVDSIFEFGRYFGLEVGSNYLLFITKEYESEEENINKLDSGYEEGMSFCGGLASGYLYMGNGSYKSISNKFDIRIEGEEKEIIKSDEVFSILENELLVEE